MGFPGLVAQYKIRCLLPRRVCIFHAALALKQRLVTFIFIPPLEVGSKEIPSRYEDWSCNGRNSRHLQFITAKSNFFRHCRSRFLREGSREIYNSANTLRNLKGFFPTETLDTGSRDDTRSCND
jgi:hypothetical protein